MTKFLTLMTVLAALVGERAALACPACLGQPRSDGVGPYVLLGSLILLPVAVAAFAVLAIARVVRT